MVATYRIAYERHREAEGRPWAIEHPSGERQYTGFIAISAPAWTVLEPGGPRFHGYLAVRGRLVFDPQRSAIVRGEDDAKEE